MRLPSSPCLVCSIWLFGCLMLGLVLLLALSKIALSFLTGLIEWFFGAFQAVVMGLIGGLAGLSAWAAIPLGATLLIVLFWMVRSYAERRQWRMLEKVREEFEPLRNLLRRRGLQTYLSQLEKVRLKLFAERDRVESVQGLLDEELPRVETRLGELGDQLDKADHESERQEFRDLMRELAATSARLRAKRGGLEQFTTAQIRVASRLNLLRQRLSEQPEAGGDLREAVAELDSITLLEDLFPAGATPGTNEPAAETTEPAAAPSLPPRERA
ncbi:MAG: hypothetical protein GX442_18290 [Candidatus Riflebacteria bacterium]|nr:hypothetical protein [Candidatus Riflebacteria bacterium]